MATVAATVANVRRLLQQRPVRAKLTAAITDTTTETFTVSTAQGGLFAVGEVWEHDDGSGELREITANDGAGTITAIRGSLSSTAATHSNSTYLIKEPAFTYDLLSQAINQCLDYDLFPKVYEIVEHQVTSNLPSQGYAYDAPSSSCEEFLDVFQVPNSNDAPVRSGITYSVYPQNADTSLWTQGKVFEIRGGIMDGTELYYVNCKHRLAIGTLLSRQERLVQMCAAKYALEWTNPKRLQGPTNQGDRTVRPNDPLVAARYWEDQFTRMKREEAEWLRTQVPPRKIFVRSGVVSFASGV